MVFATTRALLVDFCGLHNRSDIEVVTGFNDDQPSPDEEPAEGDRMKHFFRNQTGERNAG